MKKSIEKEWFENLIPSTEKNVFGYDEGVVDAAKQVGSTIQQGAQTVIGAAKNIAQKVTGNAPVAVDAVEQTDIKLPLLSRTAELGLEKLIANLRSKTSATDIANTIGGVVMTILTQIASDKKNFQITGTLVSALKKQVAMLSDKNIQASIEQPSPQQQATPAPVATQQATK